MYPFITWWGIKLYMLSIGIVVFVVMFASLMRRYCQKKHLDFLKFFYRLPNLVILTYLGGTYFYLLLDVGKAFPTTLQDLILLLSPYGYKFHLVGLLIWAWLALRNFFSSIPNKSEQIRRIDAFFQAVSISLIPFGLFLLLSDNFIGNPTTSWRGVSSFHVESKRLGKGNSLQPIGLLVSAYALLAICVQTAWKLISNKSGIWYLWFSILFVGIHLVLLQQKYARHFVLDLIGGKRDIKNFLLIGLAIRCFILFTKAIKNK